MIKKNSNIVFLGIGANIENRMVSIMKTINLLEEKCGFILKTSNIYESDAWGFESKNSFLNLCIKMETILNIPTLLSECNAIEKEIGRKKKSTDEQYSDRIIDIDILYFNNEIIEEKNLIIPHPKMHERRFVLQPLHDIAPDFIHPLLKKSTVELLHECHDVSKLNVYLKQ
ncbi:MAG: 2-amino-4-hydroxy-6-hydroxymethyldihydropteridine diphosphokinase [Bacteroidales bacterium]|nr:2-amino-4-hydroxy-6-hydroxymethyldihydropteridine diphosphokinase [Bacteroidales bacterium]